MDGDTGIEIQLDDTEPEESFKWCKICAGFKCANSVEFDSHKQTLRHEYNYILELFNTNLKSKVKDRHGIEIKISCNDGHEMNYNVKQGKVKTILDVESTGLEYTFEISNRSEKPILLIEAMLLHPLHLFELEWDSSLIATPLLKGNSRLVKVKFTNSDISYYDIPVSFKFHRKGYETYIIKQMEVEVIPSNDSAEEEDLGLIESPFQGEVWLNMEGIIFGSRQDGSRLRLPLDYPIPKEYLEIFKRKLTRPWAEITDDQLKILYDILTSFPAHVGYATGFELSHQRFFHHMLFFDEYCAKATLRHFNMTNVGMHMVEQRPDRIELRVPGLAEKRPSVLRGDIVRARVRLAPDSWETLAYEGIVSDVLESVVWITGFDRSLMNRLHEFDGMKFDIRFTLNRYTYVVQHRALDLVYEHDLLDVVFPEECAPFPSLVDNKDFEFINKMVFSNKEQREAVCNIIEGCMRPAPYIVFGPPGTGKTVTLVEAILQIKKLFHSSYVLVCAPSNATCDYLAQKLSLNCSTKELLRLHSSSRDFNSVPKDLLRYSNASGVKFERVSKDDLARYRIIVCTLTTSNRFAVEFDAYKRNMYHFTHVFIDEAGQAIEPQSLVAVGGILGHVSPHYPGGQLILAGDPKQLGPICSSSIAEKCGLGLSLLERLMEHCPLYQRDEDGKYDTRYITKLLDNFRSHPSLLELPNRLFYDGELRANCGPEVLNDPLCSTILLKTKNENPVGFTCVFHAVIGQERQEGKSPSYFNQLEIDAVMRYVAVLLGNTLDVEVEQSEIGIIAPYIRQVYKLKQRLEAKGWGDVEVGSTEAFQGREKRVILISTVRSNRNLLAYDKKYKLGFLVDPKRFNVAITRARSLMIVVGCPHVLESDPNWSALIMHSKDHGSFEGCNFNLRSDTWTREVVSRVEGPAKNKNV